MGAKITIDSATLANKGLEVIEAHFLFGLPYDRIEVVVHPTSIVHGLVRFRDGAAIAHLGLPDMRVPISYALTYPDRAQTPVPALDLTAGPLEFFEPDTDTFRLLALAREAGERGGTYPCAFNAANEVAVAAFLDGRIGFLDIAGSVEDALDRTDGAPARDLNELREADSRARERGGAGMGVVAAILGLAILVMIHEAGHFFAARAVGMTPRKFYLGFGPPIAKKTRGGVEYGIGSIPLGGYVKIPGMNRPSPGDLAATLSPEDREQHRAELARLDDAIEREDYEAAHVYLDELRPALGETRMWQELEWSLAPDAYWRQTTWRRLTAIFAGPAVNLVFAVVLFACLFMVAAERSTNVIGRVVTGSPAAAAHVQAGDRILRVAGQTMPAGDIPAHIRATNGRPFRLVVLRNGKRVVARAAAREERQRRVPDRDRDRGAHRAGRVTARCDPRRGEADLEHHCRDGAWDRAPRDRPRHEPGVELGRDRARLGAGVAAGRARLPVRARPGQPRARAAEPAARAAARRRAHRDGARREGARPHVPAGGLRALLGLRADAVRGADVLRPPQRPLRRRRLEATRPSRGAGTTWSPS